MNTASKFVVFSLDDKYFEGRSQVNRILNHFSSGIPVCCNIPDHFFGYDPDLQAAFFELFLEGWTVCDLDSESTKLRIDKSMYQYAVLPHGILIVDGLPSQ